MAETTAILYWLKQPTMLIHWYLQIYGHRWSLISILIVHQK